MLLTWVTACGPGGDAALAEPAATTISNPPASISEPPARDLAVCHLETPLGDPDGPWRGYPAFVVPPQVAAGLADTGYDACTMASNHTLDDGEAGVRRTVAALTRAGLDHAGAAVERADARRPTVIDVDLAPGRARVALLSYTYGLNGRSVPDEMPWLVNIIDTDAIRAEAARARSAGADIVLVALHWGTGYSAEASADQREVARRLSGLADIDVVFGHHAHVVQPVDRVRGTWVAYGLGNNVAAHATRRRDNTEGVAIRFTFAADGTSGGRGWRVERVEFAPTLIRDRAPYRIVDLTRALAAPVRSPALRRYRRASFDRVAEVVTSAPGAGRRVRPVTPTGGRAAPGHR